MALKGLQQWAYRESEDWQTKAENPRALHSCNPQILGEYVLFKIPEKGHAGLSLSKAKNPPHPKLGRPVFSATSGLVS